MSEDDEAHPRHAPYSQDHKSHLPENYDAEQCARVGPNSIPPGVRTAHTILAIFLLAYGAAGVSLGALYRPGTRFVAPKWLYGPEAWAMYAAMICGVLVLVSVIVDHYDRRANEREYRLFAALFHALGWGFFVLSVFYPLSERF